MRMAAAPKAGITPVNRAVDKWPLDAVYLIADNAFNGNLEVQDKIQVYLFWICLHAPSRCHGSNGAGHSPG